MTFEVRPYEARTCSWWFAKRSDIDFDPPYQRKGVVWDTSRKAFLIDSILNDFDVPKLYLADFTYFASSLNYARKQFAVVDGKQRLSAIFDFMDGGVPLAGDFVFRRQPEVNVSGMTYLELREFMPELALKVDNFNLPVMSVITDDDAAVNDLFVRLNSGRPLTAAEVRSATQGIVPQLVREITSTPFFQSCVAFRERGGAHEQAAAKLLLLTYFGQIIDTKRAQLDELYQLGGDSRWHDPLRDSSMRVMETLHIMSGIFDTKDPLLSTEGQLPIYFLVIERLGDAPMIREAIEEFHQRRRSVEGSLRRGEVDFEFRENVEPFSTYTARMRNSNDAGSLRDRVDVLLWFIINYSGVKRI